MPMKDSKMSDAWIASVCAANPPQPCKVKDPVTGLETLSETNFLSGPVRLSFCNLYVAQAPKPTAQNPNPKPAFNTNILFPPPQFVNLESGYLRDAYNRVAYKHWPENWINEKQHFIGLHSPFRMQDELVIKKYAGFQFGSYFMSPSSAFKPRVIDTAGQDIVDPAQVYAGMWAIVELNVHAIGLKSTGVQGKKGVNFGLAGVMIIAPDTNLSGGGGSDPTRWASTINIPLGADLSAAFTTAPVGVNPGGPPAPGAGMPPGYRPGALPAPPPGLPPAAGMSTMPPGYGAPPLPPGGPPRSPTQDPRRPAGMSDADWFVYQTML